MDWARAHDACVNCGTVRHRHAGHGYCAKCYPGVKEIERARRWDCCRPDTLTGCPGYFPVDDPAEFSKFREARIRLLERRLSVIRIREERREGPVTPFDLERLLIRIGKYAGTRSKNLHDNSASWIERRLGPSERIAVYQLLHEIAEDRRTPEISLLQMYREMDQTPPG